jgi:hypothetical protein
MIAFDLECSKGHLFEEWFDSIESFEKQDAQDMVSCPVCEDINIKRVLSPVTVKSSKGPSGPLSPDNIDYARLAMELINHINNEYEDMGTDFTKEALKIHYGVSDKKNIKGTATAEEEKILQDEGVPIIKFPVPKDDEEKGH